MRCRVIMSHVLGGGKIAEVGDILDLPESVAIQRIHAGRCIPAPETPPESASSGVPGGAPAPPIRAGGGTRPSGSPTPADVAPPAPEDPPASSASEASTEDDNADEPLGGRKRPPRARR
jgi:hypothetical protein